MLLVLRNSYSIIRKKVPNCSNSLFNNIHSIIYRSLNDDKSSNSLEFCNSTLLLENGYNVQELPIVVRKLKDLSDIESLSPPNPMPSSAKTLQYHSVQAEFKQCLDLRDVFSLITKCTKITPNIALGAIERIYDLEKNLPSQIVEQRNDHVNFAKSAILDKLLKVLMKTEDIQTILNILQSSSSIIKPYKHMFCKELLARVIDNKLSLEQLCSFSSYLIENNDDRKCSELIDKLWIGFIERENDINENNIACIFQIVPRLKASKRTVLAILEHKFTDIWCRINIHSMQEILAIFSKENLSLQFFAVFGSWFYMNIHALDEDTVLDIIIKLTKLHYTDAQVEKAVEKYMKNKGRKIDSYVLIVGILNYCMEFQICNKHILNTCSHFFNTKVNCIPVSFLKSFIYPYGYLYHSPVHDVFWNIVERTLLKNFNKMKVDDLCAAVLSCIYIGKYPLKVANKIFSSEYLSKIRNPNVMKDLHLIDTALSLEYPDYHGPHLPKDHCQKPITQDKRVKILLDKISDLLLTVIGNSMKMSSAVIIPNFCSDQKYLIDVMLHPPNFSSMFKWKSKPMRNDVIAILIHLPDHYCSNNQQLIGPQVMRVKHLKILGMQVVSLKYSVLSQIYTSHNKSALLKYFKESIDKTKSCL